MLLLLLFSECDRFLILRSLSGTHPQHYITNILLFPNQKKKGLFNSDTAEMPICPLIKCKKLSPDDIFSVVSFLFNIYFFTLSKINKKNSSFIFLWNERHKMSFLCSLFCAATDMSFCIHLDCKIFFFGLHVISKCTRFYWWNISALYEMYVYTHWLPKCTIKIHTANTDTDTCHVIQNIYTLSFFFTRTHTHMQSTRDLGLYLCMVFIFWR